MGKILIIKVGTTQPFPVSRQGDFEDWILAGMSAGREKALVVDVRDQSSLPGYDSISGVVIGGSHEMVTDHHGWSERTAAWVLGAFEREIPILGICYGHQLLAYALGGAVGDNPNGPEFGTVEVRLTEHALQDRLLADFTSPIKVLVSHKQSVMRLPADATLLASSAMDGCQAFVAGHNAWGVQFHPEFDAETVRTYIGYEREALLANGQDPDALVRKCVDTHYGYEILRRYSRITDERI